MPPDLDDRKPAKQSPTDLARQWATVTQPWSFAFFAAATTAAIVGLALAAPMLVASFVVQLSEWFGASVPIFSQAELTWASLLCFQIVVVALTVIMAGVARGQASSFNWQPPVRRYSWVMPLTMIVVVSGLIAIVGFTFFSDQIERDLAPIRAMVKAGPYWMAFLALAVGAPLAEELLFRGYLLNRLRQTPLGFWGAALVANIGWTALHVGYSWLSLADVFIAGMLFSWALWRTRSIWVPIIFHATYNAIVFAVLLIPSAA